MAFLEELREVREICPGPWMLAGDFNMIYCSEYKNNDNINRAMMGHFRRFVNDLELKEIALLGREGILGLTSGITDPCQTRPSAMHQ